MYNKMNYPFNMIKKRDKVTVTLHLAQVKLSRSSKTLITI